LINDIFNVLVRPVRCIVELAIGVRKFRFTVNKDSDEFVFLCPRTYGRGIKR